MALAVSGDARARELAAPAPGVRVWWMSLEPRPGDPDVPLLPGDGDRLATMRIGEARRLLARRAIVRDLVSRLAGCPSHAVHVSEADGPRSVAVDGATRWFLSTSSSGTAGVLALADVPVGVDVERLPGPPDALQVSDQLLAPGEHRWIASGTTDTAERFLRVWVRKEAVVKCTGEGLARDLRSFVVDAAAATAPVCAPDGRPLGIRTYPSTCRASYLRSRWPMAQPRRAGWSAHRLVTKRDGLCARRASLPRCAPPSRGSEAPPFPLTSLSVIAARCSVPRVQFTDGGRNRDSHSAAGRLGRPRRRHGRRRSRRDGSYGFRDHRRCRLPGPVLQPALTYAPTSDKPQSKLWFAQAPGGRTCSTPCRRPGTSSGWTGRRETWVDTGVPIDDRAEHPGRRPLGRHHLYVASHVVTVSSDERPPGLRSRRARPAVPVQLLARRRDTPWTAASRRPSATTPASP